MDEEEDKKIKEREEDEEEEKEESEEKEEKGEDPFEEDESASAESSGETREEEESEQGTGDSKQEKTEEEEKSHSSETSETKEESEDGESDKEKSGTIDEDEVEKIEEEREAKKEEDDFDDLTEDKEEPFYKPQDRTENYYQQMKNEEEEQKAEHIPSLGSMGSNMSSSSIYAKERAGQKGNSLHVLILIVIGLLVISGTVYFLKNSFNVGFPSLPFISEDSPTPTPTPTKATPEPTPTPTPLPRSDYTLTILNGTSTTGLAASTSSNLKDLGYEVERVGNATNSSFEQTLVRVKPSMLNLAEQIIRDLAPKFVGVPDLTLPETESSDSIIILGTK